MGIVKEQLFVNQRDVFHEKIAERLGITCDEVDEIEPEVNEDTGNDGAVYGYYLTFKEDAPRNILDKIEGLDDNDYIWMDIYDEDDSVYDEKQYDYIVKKQSPYNDFLFSIDEILQLMNVPVKNEKNLRYILYRQIYSSIISIMEAYLFERILLSIDKDDNLLANYFLIKNGTHNFNKDDVKLLRKHLMEKVVYHRLNRVSEIYEATFKFHFPAYKEIEKSIDVRHDIVHRNGKTTNGQLVIISRKNIEHLSGQVKSFVYKIEYNICNPPLPFCD